MMHNFNADVRKRGDSLKYSLRKVISSAICVLSRTNLKRAKSNIFTCKLCVWVIFIILFTWFLCDNSNSLTYEPRKGGKSNTFTCQRCDLFPLFVSAWHWKTDLNFAFCFSFSPNFEKRIWTLYFVFASLWKTGEGKRRNVFAECHVAWLVEWHNYAEWNICRMT